MSLFTPTSLSAALAAAVLSLAGCGGGDLSSASVTNASAAARDATIAAETPAAAETTSAANVTTTDTAVAASPAPTAAVATAAPAVVTAAPAPAPSVAVVTPAPAAATVAAAPAAATTDTTVRPVSVSAVTDNTPVSFSSSVGAYADSYESSNAGPYRVVNNTWGARNLPSGWNQKVGISGLLADNSVNFRLNWSFPYDCGGSCEVMSYPEVAYGRSASFGPDAGAQLPRRISQVSGLTTRYSGASANTSGKAHLSYDLWTSNSPNSLGRSNRLAEIMLPEMPFGGYGVPNYPDAAASGRGGQLAAGRNPSGYQGRETIGGTQYDVYYSPPSAGYLPWKFIVFEPVVFGGTGGATRDWMPLINYMVNKGWINRDDYLNSVELGVEPISGPSGTSGDVTVRGYKVDVN